MAIFGRLNGILGLETEAWTKGAKKAGDDIDGVSSKFENFLKGAKGFKRSGLGESLELLVGAGAFRVVDELAEKATKMVDKFAEMSGKIDAGDASMADMAGEMARSAPVLGTFVKFWDSVLGAVTGTTKELAEQDAVVKAQLDALEKRNAIIRDGTEAEKGFTEELRKWNQQHIVDALGDGAAGGIGKALVAQTNAAKKAQEDYAAGMKKINADLAKGQPDLEGLLKKNPDAALLPMLDKQMADLKRQQEAANKAAADAASHVSRPNSDIRDDNGVQVGTQEADVAQAKADKLAREIMDLQGVIADAKKQRDKLANDATGVINHSLIDLTTSIGKSITNPLDAAWKKTLEITGKVKAALDQSANDNRKRLADLGKQLTEEALTPTQKFLEEMKKIDTLQEIGDLTDNAHDALQKKYLDELGNTAPKVMEFHPIQAQENPFGFGRVNNQPAINGPMDKLASTAQKLLEEQRAGLRLSPDTIAAIKAGTVQVSF